MTSTMTSAACLVRWTGSRAWEPAKVAMRTGKERIMGAGRWGWGGGRTSMERVSNGQVRDQEWGRWEDQTQTRGKELGQEVGRKSKWRGLCAT